MPSPCGYLRRRTVLATALAESLLLAGRIEFFDLRQPDDADATLVRETISGHTREALRLIGHAESILAAGSQYASPDWFTWFTPVRLAAFQGNTQLKAGHLPQARDTVLANPSIRGDKQRTVILGDLAAVEAPSPPRSRLWLRHPGSRPARPDLVRHRHGPRSGSPQGPPAERRDGLRPGPR